MHKSFKQFLLEDESIPTLEEFVREHCSEYLSEVGNYAFDSPLLRGMRNVERGDKISLRIDDEVKDAYIFTPRNNRRPAESSEIISNYMDDILEAKFGWRPRAQGVFCSSSRATAGEFGKRYKIFPMGDFKYVYMPGVDDTAIKLRRAILAEMGVNAVFRDDDFIKELNDNSDDPETQKIFDRIKVVIKHEMSKFKDTNLKAAIGGQDEVTFKSKLYLAVPVLQKSWDV